MTFDEELVQQYKLSEEVFKALDKAVKDKNLDKLINVSAQLSYLDDVDIDIIVNQYRLMRYFISKMTKPRFAIKKDDLENDEIDILALKIHLSKSRRGFLSELLFKNYNVTISKELQENKKSFLDKLTGGR